MTATPETVTDRRIAIAELALSLLPADVQAAAVIDTSDLPDSDGVVVVTVGHRYARIGFSGAGFVTYLGFDETSRPHAVTCTSTRDMAAVVAAWLDPRKYTLRDWAEARGVEEKFSAHTPGWDPHWPARMNELARATGTPVDYLHDDGWNYAMMPAWAWDIAYADA